MYNMYHLFVVLPHIHFLRDEDLGPCNLRIANCAVNRRRKTSLSLIVRAAIGSCLSFRLMHRRSVLHALHSNRQFPLWERRSAAVFARTVRYAILSAIKCSRSTTQHFLRIRYPISRPFPHLQNRGAVVIFTYSR